MKILGKKALSAVNKYIGGLDSKNPQYGRGNMISRELQTQISKLAEKEITKAESKLIKKADKELQKIGISTDDLLTHEDLFTNPRGALTRVAKNRLEVELMKHNIPTEILSPESIKNPEAFITGYALDRIGNELEKHNIPRELISPETIRNPAGFLKKYAAGELAKYNVPPALIDDLFAGKIKTQQDLLMHIKGPITERINAEIMGKLGEVKIGKTNLAEIVGRVQEDLNATLSNPNLILYANNLDVIGTNNKIANSNVTEDEVVFEIRKKVSEKSSPTSVLQYPLHKDAKHCCYCVITAFEYQYDSNDILGNRRKLDANLAPKIKNLYEIRLPMPAGLASTFSANWSDYSNVWSKILRSGNWEITDGMSFNPKDLMDKITGLYQGNQAVQDSVKVGSLAAVAGIMSGNGIGGGVSEGITEALNYLRVAGGVSINPMTQATYVGSNIRTHKFTFNLIPRNKEEQIAITKIIELLEDSQLPAKRNDLGGILLDFPDCFNIRYVAPDGNPINGILEVPDSVITSVNVTRNNGQSAFKVSKDFFPITYQLEITFKEMQNLVKQDLRYLRQSAEQYKALHSGGAIPANWDPNNALKDIKPFDIGTTATGTGSTVPTVNSGTVAGIGYPVNADRVSAINKNNQYDHIITDVADKTGIPANWLKSVMYQESRMNPNAKSPVGAKGLMQVMDNTRKDLQQRGLSAEAKSYGSKDPFNPVNSVHQGAYAAQLMIRDLKYKGVIKGEFDWNNHEHVKYLTAAYNQGAGNTSKMVQQGKVSVNKENAGYWPAVLGGLNNNLATGTN